MWVYVCLSDRYYLGDIVQKVDIDVIDESGDVCVRIKGFLMRVLEGEVFLLKFLLWYECLMFELVWGEQKGGFVDEDFLFVEYIVVFFEIE